MNEKGRDRKTRKNRFRRLERGQTILLFAVFLAVLVGLAALAIDVTTLYLAHNEAQKAADAGALAWIIHEISSQKRKDALKG